MAEVRVRFAPSPTGSFHIGSARTALFNWLYARHCGGTFVLRIEDTDRERNTPEALDLLLGGMRWLGLDWDEGPGVGGGHGPYFQSERTERYHAAADRLLRAGRAYEKDGAVFFRLEGERYLAHDEYLGAEVEKVRTEPTIFDDAVRGRIERREERDFPLLRTGGDPVFHLVNVVDDIEMGITHVIRGEDHLTNTTKHLLLFEALGAPPPVYAHLPLILKDPAMGKGKMSKRDRGALVDEYQQRVFSPEALRNFLCLLGWNPKDDREIMPIDEIIERFDFPGIQKGAARFDEKKLIHMNGEYLRSMPVASYAWLAKPVLVEAGLVDEGVDEDFLLAVLDLARTKVDLVENLPGLVACFFTEDYPFDPEGVARLEKKGNPRERAAELAEQVAAGGEHALPHDAVEAAAQAHGRKAGEYMPVLRYAVTGALAGPDLAGVLRVLGPARVLDRLRRFARGGGGSDA